MAAGKELFKLWGLIGMQGVEKTNSQLKKIDKQTRKTQKEFDRLGRRAVKVGKVLVKALTLPLIATAAVAGKFRADFDEALTASLAIMGELSDAMRKDLKNAAIEVSKVTKFSAKQAAEAYFFLASAGLDAVQSIAALPQVARFAQAGNFELALATDLLTDAQSALGLSSKDTAENMENMARVSDVLVKANTIANATVAQFSESLTNKAGAALRILGKDVEEGAAVLAVFADQGLKGAASGDALNIVLRDLQRASLKNEATFKKANVAVFDGNGEMRNMADIVADLDGLLDGMSDKQKRATLTALGFQDKSISSTMALLGASDAIRGYEKDLRAAAGITEEVANKQLQTFWKQLGLLKDRLIAVGLTTDTLAGIGSQVLMPVLTKIVKAVEEANAWFNNLSPSMKKTIKGFILLAAAIGPAVFLVGKFILLGKLLIPLFVAIKGGIVGMSLGMVQLQKSMMFWTVLIGAMVALGWYWYSQWDNLKVQLKTIFLQIAVSIHSAVNDIKQALLDGVIAILGIVDKFGSMIPGLSAKVQKATIALLKYKAALFKDLGKGRKLLADTRELAEGTDDLATSIKKAIDAGKEALGLKDKDIEKTKTQKQTVLELAAAQKKAADEAKKLAKERADFEQGIEDQVNELIYDRFDLLEQERLAALARAKELKADEFNVELLFTIKLAELKDKVREEEKSKNEAALRSKFNMARNLGGKLNNILGKFADNELKRLNIKENKEIEAIKKSTMSEEQKEAAVQKIQDRTEVKRKQLLREQAFREKLFSLFQIGINTASAVVEALPNIPLALFIGGLGLAEAGTVAATPVPFQEGAFIQGSKRGVNAIVGEKNTDEIIFPVEDGIDLFLNGIAEKIGEIEFPKAPASEPALATAGGGVTLKIGTFIGDDSGLKKLYRKLDTIGIAENQRKGF